MEVALPFHALSEMRLESGGRKGQYALVCRNCQTVWEAVKGRLDPVDFQVVEGQDKNSYHLPFWKMSVEAPNHGLSSYADFVRMTNLPKVIKKAWENKEMEFWSPAFKIRPKLFLSLSKRLTVSQIEFAGENDLLPARNHPVTLNLSEAIQTLKVTLAASAVNRKKILPLLADMRFSVKSARLVYLPFQETSHEMVQEQTGFAVNKNALQFSFRFLMRYFFPPCRNVTNFTSQSLTACFFLIGKQFMSIMERSGWFNGNLGRKCLPNLISPLFYFKGGFQIMAYNAVEMADWQISEAAEKNMPTPDEWREKLGLQQEEMLPMGRLAKLDFLKIIDRLQDKPDGKYIEVTAITPTPLGKERAPRPAV